MHEELNGHIEEIAIELPSQLRMRQLLGHVSTSHAFQENFVPKFTQLAKLEEPLTATEFVDTMGDQLEEYADNTLMGITELARKHGEKIINVMIKDDDQKEAATQAWEAKIEAQKTESEQQLRSRPSEAPKKGRVLRRAPHVQSSIRR